MKPHAAGICLRFSPPLLVYLPGQPVVGTGGVGSGGAPLVELLAVAGDGVGQVDVEDPGAGARSAEAGVATVRPCTAAASRRC